MDGSFDVYGKPAEVSAEQLTSISHALSATLDPQVTNITRQQALRHLEQIKIQPAAPQYGFTLADDWTQDPAIRYYGLQLLEHAIRYRWLEYGDGQTDQLRAWVKCLAGSLREQDALYIRNKIAQLWVEVAKRSWGEQWMDMDVLLVNLWDTTTSQKSMANKTLVLYILEMLNEDIVNREDPVAGLRLDVLGHALNEIVIPQELYQEFDATRGERQQVRSEGEGWLARVCSFFADCVKHARIDRTKETPVSAVRALNTLRTIMPWINLKAATDVNLIDCLMLPFYTDDSQLQVATTEVLHALFTRPYAQHIHETWLLLREQALRSDRIAMLKHAFELSRTSPGEDDERCTLQKKLSEFLSLIAEALSQIPELASEDSKLDVGAFLDLLLAVFQTNNLVVSIPALHSWTKLLATRDDGLRSTVFQATGALLSLCSARLMRYESLPEDSDDETVQFLKDEFDTTPERHAFLGNYRRYCVSIVQTITLAKPVDALAHIFKQTKEALEAGPYAVSRGFNTSSYSKNSFPVLKFDAQFQVTTSALKGYSTWLADFNTLDPRKDESHARSDQDRSQVTVMLQQWTYDVIGIQIDEPQVVAQVLQILVLILRTIEPEVSFVLQLVQHILSMELHDEPAQPEFSALVSGFEALRVTELQKIALIFPNELLQVYEELESRVHALIQQHGDDARLVWGSRAFLFMIIHRAVGLDFEVRLARLQHMLKPVYEAWYDENLSDAMLDFSTFRSRTGLGSLEQFWTEYDFARTTDWAAQELDAAGKALQADIKFKNESLPLRMTKSMLSATTEKLRTGSEDFQVGCALWEAMLPIILPKLLQMVKHAQAFHNPSNWSHLPDALQSVVKRTLQDRFWQSGISNESKDDFYARVTGSSTSYEGFASTVRGTVRHIRELAYHIIYHMTKFQEQFYGLPYLTQELAAALFTDAESIATSHLHPIINLTTALVQRCPPHHRARFLPPLLIPLFQRMDAKIGREWDELERAKHNAAADEDLGDEMRAESILRQLAYSMVSFVPFLVEFEQHHPSIRANGNATSSAPTVSELVLSDPNVLEPLILFCTHALRMRDTRCCSAICKVFRTIIPLFQSNEAPQPQVREFICTEVLKACITSLNEPYFVDLQKELASLIAQIILLYAPLTNTPGAVLLSLPNTPTAKVHKVVNKICKGQLGERQQRALVLDLLDGVRGVSVHQQGKIETLRRPAASRGAKSVQDQYMQVEIAPTITIGQEDGLESVAELFGNG